MYELGLSAQVLPEFDRMMQTPQRNIHHCYSVGEHTIHALMQIRADKVLRLTMLFHDVAKPLCITVDDNGEEHYHGHPKMGNLRNPCKTCANSLMLVDRDLRIYHKRQSGENTELYIDEFCEDQ